MRFPRKEDVREEELAALADGSLASGRREAVEAQVARSPELADRLVEQERAVALVRNASAEVEAPPALRARIEAERGRRSPARTRRRGFALAGGLAAAAAAGLLLVLTLPSEVGGPSLAEAAALATQPATDPAPGIVAGEPKLLDQGVEGVPFPNWLEKFGWDAAGVRTDVVDGREATTVFYEKKDRRIGYTIVAGDPLDVPAGAASSRREGVDLRALSVDGRQVVTWERGGLTCILTGEVVDREALLKLAAWKGKGAIPF